MTFASRKDAGERLGLHLKQQGITADIVLGLPRGGVVVAAEIARVLGAPLDVLVVRKIGHPLHREYAIGALAEGGVILLNEKEVSSALRKQLDEVIREEMQRLIEYKVRFHAAGVLDVHGCAALLVDDGLATGSTMEAAALSLRQRGASRIIVAVPVASEDAVARLRAVADDIRAVLVDPGFDAVGRYYGVFPQTTDEEVVELLRAKCC
jgi:predicted phosphoribosyltransferase